MLQLKSPVPNLPALAARGNKIVDVTDARQIRLRGVNRSGLEYAFRKAPCSLTSAGIHQAEIDAIAGWGANIVRLPFNQAWVLES